jgi:hypothetical protein
MKDITDVAAGKLILILPLNISSIVLFIYGILFYFIWKTKEYVGACSVFLLIM